MSLRPPFHHLFRLRPHKPPPTPTTLSPIHRPITRQSPTRHFSTHLRRSLRPTLPSLRALPSLTLNFLTIYALGFTVWTYIICIMPVNGPSMSPLLNTDWADVGDKDRVWVDMTFPWRGVGWEVWEAMWWLKYLRRWLGREGGDGGSGEEGDKGTDWERGMVVALWSPMNPNRMITKRIIGLPGDIVTPKSTPLSPTTTSTPTIPRHPPHPSNLALSPPQATQILIPPGHFWLEGDQAEAGKNYDSNWYGPVSHGLLVGRVGGVVWPWRRRGRIEAGDWKGPKGRVVEREGRAPEVEVFRG